MKTTIIGIVIVSLMGYLLFTLYLENEMLYTKIEGKTEEIHHLLETSELKVERLKDELVDSLAKDCETKGVKEPDAAIILDSNNAMSLGSWMWQVKSVQHYVKQFEGREINRVEAIQIAIDHEKAHALTKKVIFEDEKGVWNWANCAKRLDLEAQVELIKKLQ